ncbi:MULTISPECIES: hypothetical protein [unclassified Acidocella]|uniref:hypothetical protein n=1 Tax=unclassified Acidocella TaxID=2648610 RepID=UPI001181AAEE|nr:MULTISPECIES: hypothetical protein [unclassified Acidocella]WBO57779.1 hypothetical protein GT370_10635 [Acidocella sp. MX-AZ03]
MSYFSADPIAKHLVAIGIWLELGATVQATQKFSVQHLDTRAHAQAWEHRIGPAKPPGAKSPGG